MKLIKKVSTVEVKRNFVVSQLFTSKNIRKKGIKKYRPSRDVIIEKLPSAKKSILKLGERSLDKIIKTEDKKRLNAYNSFDWYLGEVALSEVKVWRKTGGLYKSWTDRVSLEKTVGKIKTELKKDNSKLRRKRFFKPVSHIILIKKILQKEKYLLPIVIPNGTYKNQTGGIKTVPWFLDDGCMRSLAYAVSGDKIIKVYIGIPKG